MPAKGESAFTDAEIHACLMAAVAWGSNVSAATRALKAQGQRCPSSETLGRWINDAHAERYEELRERYRDQLEKKLVGDTCELITLAHQAQRLALEQTITALEAGEEKDPSRTAANLATVADKMTRDYLTMQGRPTAIREDRNLEEIMRSLAAKGIVRFDADGDEPTALPAGAK